MRLRLLEKSQKYAGFKVYEPNDEEIIIEKTWKDTLIPFVFISIFFILWYVGLLSSIDENDPNLLSAIISTISKEPVLIVFFVVPLFILLPLLYKLVRRIILKEIYIIDVRQGTIIKNNRLLTSLANIETLILTKDKLRLDCRLKNGEKINFLKFKNLNELIKLSQNISNRIKIAVINK